MIPVTEDHCSAGGVVLLKDRGNRPRCVSRAEQMKWNHHHHGATDSDDHWGENKGRGLFTAGDILAEEGWGSLPDPGEEVEHRHRLLKKRTGVR